MAGQIVIVNGTSGSGKSTTCELFAKQSDQFWLLYGIDHFTGASYPSKFGHHGPRSQEGIYAHPVDPTDPNGPLRWSFGEWGMKAFGAMHEWVAAASRQDCNIIFDHLLMSDPPVLQDCVRRLAGLPVLLVTLKPPFEVLMERVASREMGNRFPNSTLTEEMAAKIRDRLHRLRPWFYESVYANELADLVIDTSTTTPEQVCKEIEARLAAGPGTAGTAFEELQKRYMKA